MRPVGIVNLNCTIFKWMGTTVPGRIWTRNLLHARRTLNPLGLRGDKKNIFSCPKVILRVIWVVKKPTYKSGLLGHTICFPMLRKSLNTSYRLHPLIFLITSHLTFSIQKCLTEEILWVSARAMRLGACHRQFIAF